MELYFGFFVTWNLGVSSVLGVYEFWSHVNIKYINVHRIFGSSMVRSTRFFNINLFLEMYLSSNHISRPQSKQESKFKVSKRLLSSMCVVCACLAYNLHVEVFFAGFFFFFWDFFSNFVVEVWKCLRQVLGVWFQRGISQKYTLHDSIGHESYF